MTRNRLTDLNNHLFEQLERLNDDELTEEQLNKEVQRAQAMCNISKNIIGTAQVALKAQTFIKEYRCDPSDIPEMLEIKHEKTSNR